MLLLMLLLLPCITNLSTLMRHMSRYEYFHTIHLLKRCPPPLLIHHRHNTPSLAHVPPLPASQWTGVLREYRWNDCTPKEGLRRIPTASKTHVGN
ncbi:hypothetical protein E2C01_041570 [Portunus trituberculatus]|uniref:Secreted protein n=1 Tax=Portunus trituberculatus TaxID=210409 RepID=A0A5B7FMY3_PORTR|nr:hypothetical protein [Portunus trituberculatus]